MKRAVAVLLLVGLHGCQPASLTQPRSGSDKGQRETIVLEAPDDGQIRGRIQRIFAQVDGLEGVEVRVREGVVHLEGVTSTLSLEERAATLAGRVEHVVYVVDDIEQDPGLRERFRPFARKILTLLRATIAWLPNLAIAVVASLPFLFASLAVRRWRRPLHRLGVGRLTGSLINLALRFALIVCGLLVALDILGIMGLVGAIVGTLGLVGLVAGLAFKDWVGNYVPGMIMGLRPPFSSGDLVEVGEYEGRVLRVTPRATVLMTVDGEELRIPNASLLKEVLINYSHHRQRRLRVGVFLSFEADLEKAEKLARRALVGLDAVMNDPPPFMRIKELTQEAIEVQFLAWVDQDKGNFRTLESRAKRAVLEAMIEGEVPIAAPTLVIHLPRREERELPGRPTEDAEVRDQAFLDQRMAEAKSQSDERDFLVEGKAADEDE